MPRFVKLLLALLALAPAHALRGQVEAAPAKGAAPPATRAHLVPQPRELRIAGTMSLRDGVAVQASGPAEDRFAAAELAAALRERGVRVGPGGAVRVRLLRTDRAPAPALLRRAGLSFTPAMREEGYVLLAGNRRVDVVAESGAGLFYGVQTLRQLVEGFGAGARLREAVVRDWPALRWRGWQDDMSRGPVPSMAFIRKQIRTMAAYKANVFSPYWEHTLAYPDHPLLAPPGGAITTAEAREIVAYARAYHVTVVPEQEAFGHLHHVLEHEVYSPLAETPNGHVLAPGDPGSLPLIVSLFGHIDSLFPGPYLHIGADETFELGRGRTAEEVRSRGLGPVYIDFLKQVEAALRPFGRRLLFWGDIAVSAPGLVPSLPHDLVPVAWDYDSAASYDAEIRPFTDAGLETWVAPGVSAWNRVWPDFGIALPNIRNLTRDGQRLGATGQLDTSWDDDGETLFNSGWYGLLFGAAAAWQPGESSIADFQDGFARVFHGDTSGRSERAQQQLMAAHALLRDHGFGGASDWLFWVDPWSAEGAAAASRILPVATQLRVLAEQALRLVLQVEAGAPREPDALRALELGARRIDFIGEKFLFADQVAHMYADARRLAADTSRGHAPPDWILSDIAGMNGRLEDLRDGYSLLRDLYEQAWQRENRPYWLHNVLARYDMATRLWIGRMDRVAAARRAWERTGRLQTAAEAGLPEPPAGTAADAAAPPAEP